MMAFTSSGLSGVIGNVELTHEDTFLTLRKKLEYFKQGSMLRRTSIFTEIISFMQSIDNPHDYSVEDSMV